MASFDLLTMEAGEYDYTLELERDSTEFSVVVNDSGGLPASGENSSWYIPAVVALTGILGVGLVAYQRKWI